MNSNLSRLVAMAARPSRRIIGLMSGTSLDGLDIALCEIDGSGRTTRARIIRFDTVPYPSEVKAAIRRIFAKERIAFQDLCLLNPWIGALHASYVLDRLKQWKIDPSSVDLIASHGQTVYHAPKSLHRLAEFPNATLQIGDGDHIARKTGIITISDFRQKHLAAGGEGAPLALYGDYLLFTSSVEDRLMLNIGGIANFTFLPANGKTTEVLVTDTGPGNTLIDAISQQYFNEPFDRDALIAGRGRVNQKLLDQLLADPFFGQPLPKTTGPELFNLHFLQGAQERSGTQGIAAEDLLATATRFSAVSICNTIKKAIPGLSRVAVYASGGGARNPLLLEWLHEGLDGHPIQLLDVLGISGDAKEALLFAVLANEALCGEPIAFGRPSMPAVTMGKISFP